MLDDGIIAIITPTNTLTSMEHHHIMKKMTESQ